MNDQTIEQEIQDKGLTAPRITPADIEANITSAFYFTAAQGAEKAARDNGSYAAGSPAEGLALGLLTNKPERITRKIVEAFTWGRYFQVTAGGDTYPFRKPDPRGLIDVAARLGVPIAETVLVGDSAIDGQTAQAAGAPWIHVTWGYGKEDAWALPCWARVDRPEELSVALSAAKGPGLPPTRDDR